MSEPSEAEDVKLISSLFSPQKRLIEGVIQELEADPQGAFIRAHHAVNRMLPVWRKSARLVFGEAQ